MTVLQEQSRRQNSAYRSGCYKQNAYSAFAGECAVFVPLALGKDQEMKLFRIEVTSGDSAGRYVGINVGGGLITNQELLSNREVKVPGTEYSLYAQEGGAKLFPESAVAGAQAQLAQMGYQTEAVEVDVVGKKIA
jgi:hypothetical protein